jgi:acyl-CoA thioester hydrolase
MQVRTPIITSALTVLPAWADENGHMNVAVYLRCFDDGFYDVYRALGVEFADAVRQGFSQFIVQANVLYMKEMLVGESFAIEIQLVDHDRKRTHWFMKMKKADNSLAATCEFLTLFMDLRERKVSAMPDDWFERLSKIKSAHAVLPRPTELGRTISLEGNRKPAPL